MDMVKVAMLAVAGSMLAIQFRSQKTEYATYICFAIGILVFTYSVDRIKAILEQFTSIKEVLGDASDYIVILLKAVGITYICEFCAGICKDAGFGQVAMQIEVFGKLTILLSGMPIILALIDTIRAL